MIEGSNAHDQIAFYAPLSFLVEVHMKLFTYLQCMQKIKQKGTRKLGMSSSSLWTPHVTKVLIGPKNFRVARLSGPCNSPETAALVGLEKHNSVQASVLSNHSV